jgi:hypothetical protein
MPMAARHDPRSTRRTTGHGLVLCAALAALPLPAATGEAAGGPVEGAALHRALQGVWCNSNDGGRSCWAYDEFFADGSFEACGRTDDDPRPFRGGGPVSVSGRRMCYTVAFASGSFWLPPGSRYCTDILAIDSNTHRYRDIDTRQEFTLHRVAGGARRCPAESAP